MPKNKDNIIFAELKNKSDAKTVLEYCLRELRKQMIEFYQLVKYKEADEVDFFGKFSLTQSIMFERPSPKSLEIKKSLI